MIVLVKLRHALSLSSTAVTVTAYITNRRRELLSSPTGVAVIAFITKLGRALRLVVAAIKVIDAKSARYIHLLVRLVLIFCICLGGGAAIYSPFRGFLGDRADNAASSLNSILSKDKKEARLEQAANFALANFRDLDSSGNEQIEQEEVRALIAELTMLSDPEEWEKEWRVWLIDLSDGWVKLGHFVKRQPMILPPEHNHPLVWPMEEVYAIDRADLAAYVNRRNRIGEEYLDMGQISPPQ